MGGCDPIGARRTSHRLRAAPARRVVPRNRGGRQHLHQRRPRVPPSPCAHSMTPTRRRRSEARLAVTDFFDRHVFASQPDLQLPAHASGSLAVRTCVPNRLGFFHASWSSDTGSNSLRCAIIEPADPHLADSPLGFNHAYPWDFLVRLAREAGIVWWRDWSAKWQTVEPATGPVRLDRRGPANPSRAGDEQRGGSAAAVPVSRRGPPRRAPRKWRKRRATTVTCARGCRWPTRPRT